MRLAERRSLLLQGAILLFLTLLIFIIVPLFLLFFSYFCSDGASVHPLFCISSFHPARVLILLLLLPLQPHKLFRLCEPLSFLHCCSRFAELSPSRTQIQYKPLNPVLLKSTFHILAQLYFIFILWSIIVYNKQVPLLNKFSTNISRHLWFMLEESLV